jgi:hypothetical protein
MSSQSESRKIDAKTGKKIKALISDISKEGEISSDVIEYQRWLAPKNQH